jgi:hypothetical protein
VDLFAAGLVLMLAAEAKAAKAAEACKLLVSNLPSNATKEQLAQAFSPWGQVMEVSLNPSSGQVRMAGPLGCDM